MYSVNLMGHIEKCVFDLGLKATEKILYVANYESMNKQYQHLRRVQEIDILSGNELQL